MGGGLHGAALLIGRGRPAAARRLLVRRGAAAAAPRATRASSRSRSASASPTLLSGIDADRGAPRWIVGLCLHPPSTMQPRMLRPSRSRDSLLRRGCYFSDRRRHADQSVPVACAVSERPRIPMIAAAFGYWVINLKARAPLHLRPASFRSRVSTSDSARARLWWGLAAGLASVALLMTLRFHKLSLRRVAGEGCAACWHRCESGRTRRVCGNERAEISASTAAAISCVEALLRAASRNALTFVARATKRPAAFARQR